MFGKPRRDDTDGADRRAAGDVARIQGGGLVQVVATMLQPLEFYLFLNDQLIPQQEVESLTVSIDAPDDEETEPTVSAMLSRYITNVEGARTQQYTELFPCTLEIVANDRRISLSCQEAGSLNGLWISLGLRSDGSGAEVNGARALNIVISDGILDAKLTWNDGVTEDLLASS